MMSILEYANDVDKSLEAIFNLCDKLGIKYDGEDTMLSEDDIVLLDGEIENVSEEVDEYTEQEVLDEKVEKIISDQKIDVDNTTNKQKLKSRQERQESSKVKFQKETYIILCSRKV